MVSSTAHPTINSISSQYVEGTEVYDAGNENVGEYRPSDHR